MIITLLGAPLFVRRVLDEAWSSRQHIFDQSQTSFPHNCVVAFHAKVQVVCVIGQWANCCIVDVTTYTQVDRHVYSLYQTCWRIFGRPTSTYSSSLPSQIKTNTAHYFTRSTQTCSFRRGIFPYVNVEILQYGFPTVSFLSVFLSFITSSLCSYVVYILYTFIV